jgi:hypothetical protein
MCAEALRVPTVTPTSAARRVVEPFTEESYHFPEGTEIIVAIHLAHHHERTYPDHNQFRPERFLNQQPNGMHYLPFGIASHRCLGTQLTELEMKLAVSDLFVMPRPRTSTDARLKPIVIVRDEVTVWARRTASSSATWHRRSTMVIKEVVIVGGGIAGLLCAAALANTAEAIIIIVERDTLPQQVAHRPGIPHSRLLHQPLVGGARAMNELVPGLVNDLARRGAVRHGTRRPFHPRTQTHHTGPCRSAPCQRELPTAGASTGSSCSRAAPHFRPRHHLRGWAAHQPARPPDRGAGTSIGAFEPRRRPGEGDMS